MMNDSVELQLLDQFARFTHDPYGFVMFAFPWGEPGSELENYTGPEKWQKEFLQTVGKDISQAKKVLRYATSSGNNVGKSAVTSWLVLWALATFENTRVRVTANTERQLMTTTAAELAKWYRLFIGKSLFTLAATSLYTKDPDNERNWKADFLPWSKDNPVAFAGFHNQGKRLLVIFDEASGIDQVIWDYTEGTLTDADTEIIWAVFGNPTHNSGAFFDCFHDKKHRWSTRKIDARTVSIANHELHKEWLEDHGDDDDFFRVRVRGEFPAQGLSEFISIDDVRAAEARQDSAQPFDPIILGIDVARFGDDATVIFCRRGRDAHTRLPIILRNLDLMTQAAKIAELHQQIKPDAIFIDSGGTGAGVVDRLTQLHIPHVPIDFGSKPIGLHSSDRIRYANRRSEMWGAMRQWIKVGSLIKHDQLEKELVSPQYFFRDKVDTLVLESKKDMRSRGVASPNIADALALTFALPVGERQYIPGAQRGKHTFDYNPFAGAFSL